MRKQILCAVAVLTVALIARTTYIVVHAQTTTAAELRTQLSGRYDLVALQQGIALVPKGESRVRMIQIVNGAVTVDGDTLTAAQLRERLGADAGPIVQLTYLSAAEQRLLAGQEPPASAPSATAPATTPAPAPPPLPETPQRTVRRDDIVGFGTPVNVAQNERIDGDVVSFGGPVNIDGEVTGDVVSFGGPVTLGPHAVIRGEVNTIGGPLTRDPQAQVSGKVNDIGTRGVNVRPNIGIRNIFGSFASRAGSLATTVARVLLFTLFVLIVTAVGHRPVQQIAARIAAEPVRAGLVGLLAEILFVPLLVVTILALVISIIGIPLLILVPFGIVLVGVVMLVGFTAAAYMVGNWTMDRIGRSDRNPYLVVATGAVVIAGLTLLGKLFSLAVGFLGAPLSFVGYLIEYLAWTVGFGAAIQTWIQMRRSPAAPVATAPPEPGPA